ncbi:N-acetyl-gamma-glutamyl-phosphate reductase [Sphingomonas jejuensis]|nr:N-acetyl-gamma-glutamyl-phosphate reductase [Sphingomonas jejuensis]
MRVFIDGAAGTTGLEIVDRLANRPEFDLLILGDAERKSAAARADAIAAADITILCLPDDAARDAVALAEGTNARIIDASSAHRIDPRFAYGFPELGGDVRRAIEQARLVSNPGCYPTGFLALVRPLVADGLLPADWPVSVNAVSGYSGGGKAMVAAFENADAPDATSTAHRAYALGLGHKHLGEMRVHAGLAHAPLFTPAVTRTYRGMIVEVPLPLARLPGAPTLDDLRQSLASAYAGSPIVRVSDARPATLDIERMAGTDGMELFVLGDAVAGQARLVALLDNLGKGAAGAAIQNLNIMSGLPETAGLRL